MNPSREKLLSLVLLLAIVVSNAAALWPEISISRVDLNDNVFHFTLVERIVQAVERGENPLDCWSPEWSLGYPVLRTYQPLAHALVALGYFALGKSVALMTVFVWARFLSVALLPVSFFVAARLMGMSRLTAVAAAALAPLVSTNFLYGIEYGSYAWAGSGLFTQAVGTHFLLLALGLGYGAIRRGRRVALAGAVLGLTFLAHLIYGYMGALSVCLLASIPDAEIARATRWRRVAIVGAAAALLAAFQLAPLLLDGGNINHSRWEPAWKWDSFGLEKAGGWLFTGELLDHGRLPVLTVLALAGAGLWGWNRYKRGPADAAIGFAVWGAGFWLAMFCGRPLWGPLLTLLGVSADLPLHRVIGGAQIFLLLLSAAGLSAVWRELARRRQWLALAGATAVLFFPMVRERAGNLADDARWGRESLAAVEAERGAIDAAVKTVEARGGRGYAGLAASWGGRFKSGSVPFYAFLSTANVPAVAFLYHSMALTGDVMLRFNEWNPSHYRLFDIRTVVAPAGAEPATPPFLMPLGQQGRFRLFAAPGAGYFEVVDVLESVRTTRNNFYDINDRWLQSDWVAKRLHVRLDLDDDAAPRMARLAPEDALPALPLLPSPGEVRSERREGEVYSAELNAVRPCYALFRMTWHANWKAYLDGKPVRTAMLSPGFVGVPLGEGRHRLAMRYEPEGWKAAVGFAGLGGVLLLMLVEWRAGWSRVEAWRPGWSVPAAARRRLLTAAGLALLAAPVCVPLLTGSVLWGHDGFAYFPRLVELDQNLAHGILLPRWAPDLGRGTGQPLFLFHPPMIYYLGELWHLAGFDFVTAMNLACVAVVLLSAVGMFLLARLYFGEAGGWLGAAAYLYVPYFAVDLYVRSAMEEFAAFPFFALALYGFGAYARHRRAGYWLLGALAYAAVLFSHFPAALLFTPLLLLFLGLSAWMEKSWSVLVRQAGGFGAGLGLSAVAWLPALAARHDVAMERAVQGNGLYTNHFVYLEQLFYSPWGYGYSLPGPNDGMSFALGWSHVLLALAAGIWLWRRPKWCDGRVAWAAGAAAMVLCCLMLEDAAWLWRLLPLLQNVQLPWRLLGPVAICLALGIAPLGRLLEHVPRLRTAGMVAAMGLVIVPNLAHLHSRQAVDVDLSFWTPEQLALRGFETTTMGEVEPRWIPALPAYRPAAAEVLSGDAAIERQRREPFAWSSAVRASVASNIEMNTAWFPGWEVLVDGRRVPAEPDRSTGLITFTVPPGVHVVEARYGRTGTEKAAAGISIGALMLMLVLAGRELAGARRR
ncbi:MAG: glycosyltransferase family 39 protein [Acidobacteria bacterium]|nr:glycosyltransferase family 39 protein [Acidobacteriota bacterium]